MKSVASNDKCEKKELPFPKLMVSDSGAVYLMSNRHTGTRVYTTTGFQSLGHHSTSWIVNDLTDYIGSVCLTNEDQLMTVEELVEKLYGVDPNATVIVLSQTGGTMEVSSVEGEYDDSGDYMFNVLIS